MPGVVAHACVPKSREVESEGSWGLLASIPVDDTQEHTPQHTYLPKKKKYW